MKMTSDEFDSTKLRVKIDFRMSEAARVVLVNGFSKELACQLYLNDRKDAMPALLKVLEMFEPN